MLACATAIGLVLGLAGSAFGNQNAGGWDRLGLGAPGTASLNGRVDVLDAVAPDALYAGGAFTSAGGDATASHIARWDGNAWHVLGAPALNGDIRALAYYHGTVYVGGTFTNAGGNTAADFLASWDGVSWQPFCNPITATVNALQVIGSDLYIGGDFADGANLVTADKLVECDLDTGTPHSTVNADGDINSSVLALAADSSGRLYAGGTFINMDQIAAADHVAMYDGTWHAMGSGTGSGGGAVDDIVRSLASDGTNVYAGTDSLNVAGIANADHIARWNGSAWSAVGSNAAGTDGWFPTTTFINSIATSGSELYVGGSFQNADGVPNADMVAHFDGTNWIPMGSDGVGNGPVNAAVNAVAMFAGQTVVGGNFTAAGGDPLAQYVARFPGTSDILPTANASWRGATLTKYPVSSDWTSSDADGTVVGYRWHWDDGTPDTTGTASSGHVDHRYTSAGTYHPQLIVTDNDGGTGTLSQTVVVRVGPISAFTWSPLRPMVGQTVFLHGAATDVDGTIVGYSWFWGPANGLGPNEYLPNAGPSPTITFTTAGDKSMLMTSYECDPTSPCLEQDFKFETITVIPASIPRLTQAAVSNTSFRVGPGSTAVIAKVARGTKFRFGLKAPATVVITIRRSAPNGRKHKPAKAVGKLVRNNLQPGPNTVPFSGRIGKRALKPGPYTATVSASNGTGKAKPVTVKFTIVK